MDKKDTHRITIQECNSLVPPGKSKRLAALRRQSRLQGSKDPETQEPVTPTGLSREALEAFRMARARIERQIESIKHRYPPGRQNKLFAIRFGEPALIKRRSIKEIFDLLAMEPDLKNFNLIAQLNFDGDELCGEKDGAVEKVKQKRP